MTQLELHRRRCVFYLGISEPRWHTLVDVKGPTFISAYRLRSRDRKSPHPRSTAAMHPWAFDSGAFSMIACKGRWDISVADYVAQRSKYPTEFGEPDWSAAQDYMCETKALNATGLSIRQHQLLTVSRYRRLVQAAPNRYWVPVLQGWEEDDYLRHVDDYERAGVRLHELPLVGVGSTCRRQGTRSAGRIYRRLADQGLKLHGFGVSLGGVRLYHELLVSADSQAWSRAARHESADSKWAANQLFIGELYRDRIEAAIDGVGEDEAAERWREAMTWVRPSRRTA